MPLTDEELAETDSLWADTQGGTDMELTRAYGFSAAHRLADPARPDDDNRRLYGKCANPEPHGHDYRFEVTVRGVPDARTGLLTNLGVLDSLVESRVLSTFDHRYLNDISGLELPTLECISRWIWDRLHQDLPGIDRVLVRRGSCGEGCMYSGRAA